MAGLRSGVHPGPISSGSQSGGGAGVGKPGMTNCLGSALFPQDYSGERSTLGSEGFYVPVDFFTVF